MKTTWLLLNPPLKSLPFRSLDVKYWNAKILRCKKRLSVPTKIRTLEIKHGRCHAPEGLGIRDCGEWKWGELQAKQQNVFGLKGLAFKALGI